MSLGNIIKDAREDRGLTQKDLAALVKLPPSYICRLEKGHGDVWDVFRVARVVRALGLHLDDIVRECLGDDEDTAARLQPAAA